MLKCVTYRASQLIFSDNWTCSVKDTAGKTGGIFAYPKEKDKYETFSGQNLKLLVRRMKIFLMKCILFIL